MEEYFGVNRRALRLIHSFSKNYFPLLFISNLLDAFNPYYNVFLSAALLNEICGLRSEQKIFVYIVMILVGNCFLGFVKAIIVKYLSQEADNRDKQERRILGKKHMTLRFSAIEDGSYRKLRKIVDESSRVGGNGKKALIDAISSLEYNLFTLFIATYLFTDMLIKIFNSDSSYAHTLYLFAIIILSIANIIISQWHQKKELLLSNKTATLITNENRYDDSIDSYHIGKDVRIYHQAPIILELKGKYLVTEHKKHFEWMFKKAFWYSIPVITIQNLLKLSIYFFITYYVVKGVFDIGGLIRYVGFVEMFTSSIKGIVVSSSRLKENRKYLADYLKLFECDDDVDSGTRSIEEIKTPIIFNFCNVYFRYPGSQEYVFNNFSLSFGGEGKYAIVGENGSGKTTLIKLLCRFYRPDKGEIRVNGINIWEFKYDEYISLIGAVFQDYKLLPFSIAQNVSSSQEANRQRVMDSLVKSGFGERLATLEKGIDTNLYKNFEEDGIEISGGEAQKIAIARALYKNTPVIILDEPTAALDPIAEVEIFSKFNEISVNNLTIYISHRLSSCKFCDDIIVLDKGKLVQRGTHHNLIMNKQSKYYELWNAQAQYYKQQ